RGDYALEDVGFYYDEEEKLTVLNISKLQIRAGERVAVLGRNGSGKSTLLQLLAGMQEPQQGSILLDDIALNHLDPADVRRDMQLLSQQARLFFGSVRDNILMGNPLATDDEIHQALVNSGALEFVRKQKMGLNTIINEGGTGLSGGQRQALLLARALITSPTILLLDEPTAWLDEMSEKQFIQHLHTWLGKRRTLVVATHRLPILDLVDRIIVLENGKVVMDGPDFSRFNSRLKEPRLPRATLVAWSLFALLAAFIAWASLFHLDEVTTGSGKVIPSSHEQVIQSLEGGIIHSLMVREGDIVERGQQLAQLDRTKTESSVLESESRLNAALATAARLKAEVNDTELTFPEELDDDVELVKQETALYQSRRESLEKGLAGLRQGAELVQRELSLTRPLVTQGAASKVEVLRLERQKNELENKITEMKNQYYVRAREELAKANAEIEAQRSVMKGREDSLTRLTFNAPVRGIVKDIDVTTVGGVIPPNGKLMSLVPLDDQMVIEAKISPRDVAFIHPGQKALVKVTAYDYSIYGGLEGEVTMISPDTLQDEVKRDVYYYRVYIRTDSNHLTNKQGQEFPVFPGMIATVDIKTGSKTILDYLLKPLNKAKEALRER
ncbi:MAG: HlyD family type I secretion periplasmic adaptor subunit, partial [Enterococcus faecalis]|nr:HlyD family type I secretion periplasmic adaptor subunit [Enterococcus faecalis]